MSSKKRGVNDKNLNVTRRTPKQITPKSKSNHNVNQTLRGNVNLTILDRANSTSCQSVPVPFSPVVDYELQCDFAYNDYLQSLITMQITQTNIEKFEIQLNDQLSIQTDILLQHADKKHELERKIETYELRPKLEELFNVLEKYLNKIVTVLNPEVEKTVDNLIELLNKSCNQLHLNRVKMFTSQDEYDKFMNLLQCCMDNMKRVNFVCGDVEDMQKLVDCLNNYKKLNSDVAKVEDSVIEMQNDLINLALKSASDLFAKYRGYD